MRAEQQQQNLGRRFCGSKLYLSPPEAQAAVCSKAVVLDLLFYVLSIVCGASVLVFVLVCITLCPF